MPDTIKFRCSSRYVRYLYMLRSLAFALALAKYDLPVYFVGGIGGFIGVTIYAFFHNRMMAYVEDCIYGGKWDEYKGKENVD